MFRQSKDDDVALSTALQSGVDPRNTSTKGQSVIGPTLKFKGEIAADEDLLILGDIEGRIAHHKHLLTIGEQGRVRADIHARIIIVEGQMEGDLYGDEAVVLKRNANVIGNIFSPRIAIEDGARFNGSINMTEEDAALGPAEPVGEPEIRGVG